MGWTLAQLAEFLQTVPAYPCDTQAMQYANLTPRDRGTLHNLMRWHALRRLRLSRAPYPATYYDVTPPADRMHGTPVEAQTLIDDSLQQLRHMPVWWFIRNVNTRHLTVVLHDAIAPVVQYARANVSPQTCLETEIRAAMAMGLHARLGQASSLRVFDGGDQPIVNIMGIVVLATLPRGFVSYIE